MIHCIVPPDEERKVWPWPVHTNYKCDPAYKKASDGLFNCMYLANSNLLYSLASKSYPKGR